MNVFELDWSHWRTFLAVLDEGSLSGAARKLALTQPTVGRHIDAIEAGLNSALFMRTPNGLAPTELALRLIPHARQMAASAAALLRTASGGMDPEQGTVRLTASEMMGVEVLPHLISGFVAEHPLIRLEIDLSDRNADLLRRDADIAIRMVRPKQAALLAKRIGFIRLGLYAHSTYAARRELPNTPAELFQHVLIGPEDDVRLAGMSTGRPLSTDIFSYRTNSDLAQLSAVRAGIGIGLCQDHLAQRNTGLVPVLPNLVSFDMEMWLAMHEDLRTDRRVRLVFDYLASALNDYVKGERGARLIRVSEKHTR